MRSWESIDPRVSTVIGDVENESTWHRYACGVPCIVHLAAQTSAYVADSDPLADEAANVRPMMKLLEVCRHQHWKPFILFASTVTVAGLPKELPVAENCAHEPVTVYDLHKLMAEEYLELYVRLGHVRGATLRLANVYGPGPKSNRPDRGILNVMIRKALAGEPLTVYGHGGWVRDYIYIDDVVTGFERALDCANAVNGRHWIIGSGVGTTVSEAFHLVAERVEARTGRRVPVQHVEPPAGLSPIESRNFVADVRGFSVATGWQPAVALQEGIDRTIDAILSEESEAGR